MRLGWPFLLLALACSTSDVAPATAEIGVFYGGQVQRAEHLEVSTVRPPKIGFRVHLPSSSPGGQVRYELVRPGPAGRRVTKNGSFEVSRGQETLDHVFSWDDTARLGIWNVRVTLDDQLLADRAIYLTKKAAASP
jgi:hypothetical protein